MSGPQPPAGGHGAPLPVTDPLHGLAPAPLAGAVRANPGMALRLLQQPGRLPVPPVQAILLAETHLRLGQGDPATGAAIDAVTLAAELSPPQPAVLLAAVTVLTDICVCTADPHAVAACSRLCELAEEHQDQRRLLIAKMLHAVAVCHHDDCARGQHLLADLHHHPADESFTAILTRATTTMKTWCATPPAAPAHGDRRFSPVPGGLLHPDPTRPATAWLDQRITVRPCAGTHPGATGQREAQP